jgi:hypothetical protein
MSKARPEEKISEVVDDMMDAVAGLTPQVSNETVGNSNV